MNVQQYVERLGLVDGQSVRQDCPVCGGRNTFSASKHLGMLRWNCFKASCNVRGKAHLEPTVKELEDQFFKQDLDTPPPPLYFPEWWVEIERSSDGVKYLQDNHCWDAYRNGLVSVMYDVRSVRAVFLISQPDTGLVVDAAGRALKGCKGPKWYRYASSGVPFMSGPNKGLGVLVEDCASACAVSSVATGVSILGTSLRDCYVNTFLRFDKVLVCLDPDAMKKALDFQQLLTYYVPTEIMMIPDDLKYYGPDDIKRILKL